MAPSERPAKLCLTQFCFLMKGVNSTLSGPVSEAAQPSIQYLRVLNFDLESSDASENRMKFKHLPLSIPTPESIAGQAGRPLLLASIFLLSVSACGPSHTGCTTLKGLSVLGPRPGSGSPGTTQILEMSLTFSSLMLATALANIPRTPSDRPCRNWSK